MPYTIDTATLFIPDQRPETDALARTTHLGIGAHPDDLEIMALDGILQCYQREDRWFTGVIVTDGRGSSRSGPYATYSDEHMRQVRNHEQRKAAYVGEYAAQIMLDFPSRRVKDAADEAPIHDLSQILRATRPEVVYTHNLMDKHDTHIGVVMKTLLALRALPPDERPQRVIGCEVWRDLDWMIDEDKIFFDVSQREGLQMALVGLFDSQISGGKRYDLATMGRRRAHATYHQPHAHDLSQGLILGMDLTPLIQDDALDILSYAEAYIQRFAEDVRLRLRRVSPSASTRP